MKGVQVRVIPSKVTRFGRAAAAVVVASLLLLPPSFALALPALDATFGGAGVVTTDLSGRDRGIEVANYAGGGLVVLAQSQRSADECCEVVRLEQDGSLVEGFGDGGSVVLPLSVASAIAVQQDGRILVAGRADDGSSNGVYRLLPGGELDPSFGREGFVDIPRAAWVGGLAVQANGGVLVSGKNLGWWGLVIRLDPDGSQDTDFAEEGEFLTPRFGNRGWGARVDALPDGRILVSESLAPWGVDTYSVFLTRLTPDGVLDGSFGDGGTVKVPVKRASGFNPSGYGGSVAAIGRRLRIYVAVPLSVVGAVVCGIVRLHADGRLDRSYGSGAIPMVGTLGSAYPHLDQVGGGSGGRVSLVVGRRTLSQGDSGIAIVGSDGSFVAGVGGLLPGFETEGIRSFDPVGDLGSVTSPDFWGATIDSNGRTTVVGSGQVGGQADLLVLRLRAT